MDQRIPYSAKGKGIAHSQKSYSNYASQNRSRDSGERAMSVYENDRRSERSFSPPPKKRIRAPTLDNSELIQENSLTLMGRLTNPSAQRLWSLIPFLSNRWNLKGKATGSDLGRGCFQFRFEYEEDLQKVLDNRPYHFGQWMVILQRWKPVISPSFPSEIPFWIELQGLPMHYWIKEMLYAIGKEAGEVVDHEISPAAAKIKVLINGLQPITKETVVEFPDGSEALVYLEYKNLKSHCHHCQRLSHAEADCPGLKKVEAVSKTSKLTSPEQPPQNYAERNKGSKQNPRASHDKLLSSHSGLSRPLGDYNPYKRKSDGRNGRSDYRLRPGEMSETSRTRRPPLEREVVTESSNPLPVPIPTKEAIMGELREVTVQYTSCADPTESMARKQRVLQGEARGLMLETADQILTAATSANQLLLQNTTANDPEPPLSPSQDLPIHPAELPPAPEPSQKKKRRRSPINKPSNKPENKSPLRLAGAKSSKRNMLGVQNSPKGRTVTDTAGPSTGDAREIIKKKQSKQQNPPRSNNSLLASSSAPPTHTIIPAMVKKKVDFQSPPPPLP
ncbi:hypothetical protein AXX17_AT4G01860 [Arabidopsis thaliana]|uniref:DUF4283 domain-containing protein n=1 Tax=Arabidopsis thaliana TaxID=3702 RepID=A0A178UZQ5_ARATH|nr:hypothetical protein AXX17_AT4G01860 [Arabidopsis thaliana]